MDETLDWMDEFDDSVLTDSIEANDSSALTGFDNTETEKETTSPLEAKDNVTQPSGDFWDNLENFTPTINFSRESGPPSSNSGGSNHGSGTSTSGSSSGGSSGGSDSTSSGGDSGSTSGGSEGGSTSTGGSLSSRIKNAIATVTSASSAAVGSGGSVTSSLSSGLSGIASKYGAEAAKDASNAAAKANAEAQSAEQAYRDLQSQVDDRQAELNAAADKQQEAYTAAQETKELNDLVGKIKGDLEDANVYLTATERERYYELMAKYQPSVSDGGDIKEAITRLAVSKEAAYGTAVKEAQAAEKAWSDYVNSYNVSKANAEAAAEKAKEALAAAQAAKDKAGTLAGEAKDAFDRAQEKQKEWEQKQKEAEDAARAEGKDGTTSDSAINNPVTLDLATSLANSGAKMTETEYKQVADFVANHPELASLINGGLTGAEKATIANVIAGIQAINDGNYLTAAKEFAQGLGMSVVSAVQLISTGIYGAGARIVNIVKSFMENPDINYDNSEDFKTFKQMRDEYGDSTELQALYDTSKGTTEQKQTFDYMKDNAATNVGEYNEGLIEDVNKVVSDSSRKVIHYSPYVLEAVKKWR